MGSFMMRRKYTWSLSMPPGRTLQRPEEATGGKVHWRKGSWLHQTVVLSSQIPTLQECNSQRYQAWEPPQLSSNYILILTFLLGHNQNCRLWLEYSRPQQPSSDIVWNPGLPASWDGWWQASWQQSWHLEPRHSLLWVHCRKPSLWSWGPLGYLW